MAQPICLITGGNSGIGKAAAIQLASRGARVVVASRSPERGESAVGDIRQASGSSAVSLVVMDLSSRQSILDGCDAFRGLGFSGLDALIHNAGDFDITRKQRTLSMDGVESIWATNHVGPVLLTQQLEPELSAAERGRVITVSSQGLVVHPRLQVDLEDPEFAHRDFKVDRAYYQSKLAQVMYTLWLAQRYQGTSKTANCVRVTNVKIDVTRYQGLTDLQKRLYSMKSRFSISPEQMAEVYTWLAIDPETAQYSGGYFDEKRKWVQASAWASDPDNVRSVMELTARYVPELLE